MIAYFSMPGSGEWLVLITLLLIVLAGAVALFVGARVIRIQRPTFSQALSCRVLSLFACFPVWLLLRAVPVAGPVLGLGGALLVDGLITRAIFRTTFPRAVAADVVAWVLSGMFATLLLRLYVMGGIMPAPAPAPPCLRLAFSDADLRPSR